jgi:hypothetical protein
MTLARRWSWTYSSSIVRFNFLINCLLTHFNAGSYERSAVSGNVSLGLSFSLEMGACWHVLAELRKVIHKV